MIGEARPLTKVQAEGLAAIVVMAAMLYVFLLLIPYFRSSSVSSVPFSVNEAGMQAVALNVDGKEKGVFFVPPGTTVAGFLSASGAAVAWHFNASSGGRHLQAGDKIYLTSAAKSSAVIDRIGGALSLALELPLDINKVPLDELVLVPGIGDKTAERIIALRRSKGRFRTLDELKEIKGIKEKRLAHLSRYLGVLP